MRNETSTLSPVQALLDTNVLILASRAVDQGATLALTYTKRDGTTSAAEGTYLGEAGTEGMSTSAIKVLTERGPRTINTYLVKSMVVTLECGSTVESHVFADLSV